MDFKQYEIDILRQDIKDLIGKDSKDENDLVAMLRIKNLHSEDYYFDSILISAEEDSLPLFQYYVLNDFGTLRNTVTKIWKFEYDKGISREPLLENILHGKYSERIKDFAKTVLIFEKAATELDFEIIKIFVESS